MENLSKLDPRKINIDIENFIESDVSNKTTLETKIGWRLAAIYFHLSPGNYTDLKEKISDEINEFKYIDQELNNLINKNNEIDKNIFNYSDNDNYFITQLKTIRNKSLDLINNNKNLLTLDEYNEALKDIECSELIIKKFHFYEKTESIIFDKLYLLKKKRKKLKLLKLNVLSKDISLDKKFDDLEKDILETANSIKILFVKKFLDLPSNDLEYPNLEILKIEDFPSAEKVFEAFSKEFKDEKIRLWQNENEIFIKYKNIIKTQPINDLIQKNTDTDYINEVNNEIIINNDYFKDIIVNFIEKNIEEIDKQLVN